MSDDVVKTVVLQNGTEIVAFVQKTNAGYTLAHPVIPQITPSGNLGFVPYLVTSKINSDDAESIEINEQHVMIVTDTRPDIEQEYRKAFSPIIVPEKQLITG